jgi:hypothetical protein
MTSQSANGLGSGVVIAAALTDVCFQGITQTSHFKRVGTVFLGRVSVWNSRATLTVTPCRKPWYALAQSREIKLMPVGLFREEGWVQVDYGTGTTIPVPRSKYEANGYKPDFDKLPSEAEYSAAEKKKEDDSKGA